jgi:HNH endonuclease
MFQVDFSVLPERFKEKVFPDIVRSCWVWFAGVDKDGYGKYVFRKNGRRHYVRAHRYCWTIFHGPIPDGLQLDHLCKNPRCVNPAHLELVTRLENVRRGDCWQRWRRRTHCSNGHPLSGYNLFIEINKHGHQCRRCRICLNEKVRINGKRYRAMRSKNQFAKGSI